MEKEIYAQKLSTLIQCETISTYYQKDKSKFYAFREELKKMFPTLFSLCEEEDFDGTFLLKWKGKGQGEPILFMNHHDVVEATGEWKYPPFSGEIAENKVWGRGTLDTKGGLFCMLQAGEELAQSGFVPSCDIYFESSCTEEVDGSGCKKVAEELEKRGLHFAFVLDEGGMIVTEPIAGAKGRFAMIGVGEKGCADVKFIARSHGGHASTPPRNTPLVRLGKMMAEGEKMKMFPAYLNPVVQEMFVRLAPTMSGGLKFVLGHPKLFKGLLKKAMPLVSPVATALLKTTVAFTTAKGSDGLNVIPQEAYVTGNVRISHHQGRENTFAVLRTLAKKYDVEMEILDPGEESGIADYKSAPFRMTEEAVKKIFPDVTPVPYIMTGASDARYLDKVSDNCIRFVPFSLSDEQLGSIHGLNECVDVDNLGKAVEFYKQMMMRKNN